ncbi:MAG: zinc ribbon domain-containing protein [Ruminococcaceae bacterium]|nr:zinc ribbon domain-containing protein [Oscillospiraceae bacterium]
MKSVKPGRGPSFMSGVIGIVMILFGIFWTAMAARFSGIMAVFGVLWTVIAVMITIYNFKNATGKNRYSQFDITEHGEEPDPLEQRFGSTDENEVKNGENKFCPYCGAELGEDFVFCNNCGKKLP